MSYRVAVFDPHPIVQDALVRLLPPYDLVVASQVFDGDRAINEVRRVKPDVVITEVLLPNTDGLRALENLAEADLHVKSIVYSDLDNPTYVARAIAVGASDYLLKSQPLKDLAECLVAIVKNKAHEPSDLFTSVQSRMRETSVGANPHVLTVRENQVLRHLGFGLSNREIARSLQISVETVKEHVQNILRKQDSNDRTQAAVRAVREGLV